MPFVPVRIQPGMLLNTTQYDAKGRWVEGNWVRFWRQKVRPIGGWESAVTGSVPVLMDGVARAMHPWSDLDEEVHLGIGTNLALYTYDGSNLLDITPVPLPPGNVSGGTGEGFGGENYGEDEYGTPRAFLSLTIVPATWTMDNWGSELVACPNWTGAIYKWAPGDPEATLIEPLAGTEVPQDNRGIVVSNQRHLIAIGAGFYNGASWEKNQRRIAWSTQENYAEWTPTVSNSAGDLELQTAGLAICGTKFKQDILIFTNVDVHRMSYLGPPYYYGISRLASNAGIVSANAYTVTNRFTFWVARDSFMIYDGTVKELDSDVSEWFRDRINPQHLTKTVVGHNPRFNEVWIHLTGRDSEENSEYVIWNYEENTWSVGFLSRTTWNETAVFDYPMACEPVGTLAAPQSKLYYHERGYTADGVSRNGSIYIETFPMEIAAGDNLVVCRRFVQDTESDSMPPSTALTVEFTISLAPEATETVEGPYVVDTGRGYTDVRFTGRQMKMRFNQVKDEDWSIGDFRLEVVPGSGR
jgi:hypothetical protein